VLDGLEERVAAHNFSLQQAASAYEEAREVAREDRAGLLPTLSAVGTAQRQDPARGQLSTPPGVSSNFGASLEAAWEPDFWGKARRTTEAAVANAQVSAADLASARLSTQAPLAQDYIDLRISDEKERLLNNALADYRRTLAITRNKYAVGVAARSDILAAQTQLDSTRVQAMDVGIQRAQYEHAIAILVGLPPSDFSIPAREPLGLSIPDIPAQVPSELLERRPDIASAERAVAAANANIGVQTAGYFPSVSLSAAGGYSGSPLDRLITAPNRLWSLGAQVGENIFDAGAQRDLVRQARAAHDASVAGYRQAVLTAFQQVEDNLAGIRILGQEVEIQDAAVAEAAEATRITLNEYQAGTVDFTTVTTVQVTELNNRETALSILQNRLLSGVALVEALGGGWSTSDLPMFHQVLAGRSPDGASPAAPR
jgi:NodT family efflux transporter outer membrane factor (OMF) lipoprotein